jgi:2,4'-dihydroxyacetophenone dioxygenase
MSVGYNPEFNPTGIEGSVDTNLLPWIPLPQAPGMSLKSLRASSETGAFSVMLRLEKGTTLPDLVHLGAMDMMVLDGVVSYPEGPMAGRLEPGTWGYVPANTRVKGLTAEEDTELLTNFFGPVAFLGSDGKNVDSLLTSLDIQLATRDRGITLVPNTLADCMQARPPAYEGPTTPIAISRSDARHLVGSATEVATSTDRATHPHFIDTRMVPWYVNPATPDVGLKVLRISEETGFVSVIVRHNGEAPPHYHLGAADFFILGGRIGYRAGPPDGYGAGVWFYEPAGARHEATQRISEEDLIYTANLYGPIQFDSGPGTPIAFVFSWMQYLEMAEAAGTRLMSNVFPGDTSLLAWTPVGAQAVPL